MPCFFPLTAYRSKIPNPTGKRSLVFNKKYAWAPLLDFPVTLPCRQCVGCRLERSRQWAIRCSHEAQLYENNAFITLTFNDQHLPPDKSLDVRHFQLFIKRLRKKYGPNIRFFHCGEYGPVHARPHYHACLFNHDFLDKKPWKISNGHTVYRSASLEGLWSCPKTKSSYGYSSTAAVTFHSAAYVARYIMKKITGDAASDHYEFVDQYGEIHQRKPEYTTMSRRPGIGKSWLDQYQSDVYPHDFVVMNGKKMRPPAYYDTQYEIEYPSEFKLLKSERKAQSLLHVDNQTPDRLKIRHQVTLSKISQLPRDVE